MREAIVSIIAVIGLFVFAHTVIAQNASCIDDCVERVGDLAYCQATCDAGVGGEGGTVNPTCNCGEPNCRLLPCPSGAIPLFAPLDGGSKSLSPDVAGPFGYFFTYVNRALPWLVAIAVGMAVLQGVVGGMQILFSAGGAGKDAGKDRLLWAMAGFVLLTLTGFILKTINPLFFR